MHPIWSRGWAAVGKFDVSVAAYPEGHPESRGIDADLENLKRKVDAGAGRAITQFLLRYGGVPALPRSVRGRRNSRAPGAGHTADHTLSPLLRFAERCGASVPAWLRQRFDGLDDDPETRRMIAANVAIEQVQHLRRHGVESSTSTP